MHRLFLAFAASCLLAIPVRATTVLRLSLDEIVDTAAVAFQGTCVGNRTELDRETGMVVTYTTFQVQDVLKGQAGFTHVIKQIGGELAGDGRKLKAHGVPGFTPGGTYVLFLAGKSSAGFSSPIGLTQGAFVVVSGDAGPEVTNGQDFGEMTSTATAKELPAEAKAKMASGARVMRVGLEDFKRLVRGRTGVAK